MRPQIIQLPPPQLEGAVTVEAAMRLRRSVRNFQSTPLSLKQTAQLLWAGQGLTSPRGFRTAPSAGALYPLEMILAAGAINDLAPGIYRYQPQGHCLALIASGDRRDTLCKAALRQSAVRKAPALVAICAVFARVSSKYGQRGIQYTHMEVGHAAQNICLQAVAMGLGTVVLGAYDDHLVQNALAAAPEEVPLYLIPCGAAA